MRIGQEFCACWWWWFFSASPFELNLNDHEKRIQSDIALQDHWMLFFFLLAHFSCRSFTVSVGYGLWHETWKEVFVLSALSANSTRFLFVLSFLISYFFSGSHIAHTAIYGRWVARSHHFSFISPLLRHSLAFASSSCEFHSSSIYIWRHTRYEIRMNMLSFELVYLYLNNDNYYDYCYVHMNLISQHIIIDVGVSVSVCVLINSIFVAAWAAFPKIIKENIYILLSCIHTIIFIDMHVWVSEWVNEEILSRRTKNIYRSDCFLIFIWTKVRTE